MGLAQHATPTPKDNTSKSLWRLWLGADAQAQKNHADPIGVKHGPIKSFLDNLTVEPIRYSKLVKVHYDSPDPDLAARIANTLADVFIHTNLERRFDAASYAKNFLEQRLAQFKAKLEDSEQKRVAFARTQGIINIDEKQTLAMQKLQALSQFLSEAEKERVTSESLYREALNAQDHGLSKILDNEMINHLKEIKANLGVQYHEQEGVFKPDYPKMQQLRSQIAEVQAEIDREVDAIHASLRADYQTARRKEAMLKSELGAIKEEVLRLQDQSSQYNILMREVDTNRTLYDGLLQRLKKVGIAGGVSMNNISVIDAAKVPNGRFKPNVRKNLLLEAV